MSFFKSGFFDTGASGLGQREKTNEITTTDATATDILSIPLAEGQTMSLEVQITGRRTDSGNAGLSVSYRLAGAFKRNASGNVTQVSLTQSDPVFFDDGAAWDATLNADTTNQTVDVRVTGEIDVTIKWTARANYTIQSS
ncbi:MAG: hypothetical protein C4542_08200 [Dehalococcoidia bacterium]|nr:MAG: hypothetical protein C4542_08200 [Dehalococcoidia bacterium]